MPTQKITHRYDDIIALPHHQSTTHPPMPLSDRAIQFAPFAALSGYEEAVLETARLTDKKIELDEYFQGVLNERLNILRNILNEHPEVCITYYIADRKKSGGVYVDAVGTIKKLEKHERIVVMQDGTAIPMNDIIDITGDLFCAPEYT